MKVKILILLLFSIFVIGSNLFSDDSKATGLNIREIAIKQNFSKSKEFKFENFLENIKSKIPGSILQVGPLIPADEITNDSIAASRDLIAEKLSDNLRLIYEDERVFLSDEFENITIARIPIDSSQTDFLPGKNEKMAVTTCNRENLDLLFTNLEKFQRTKINTEKTDPELIGNFINFSLNNEKMIINVQSLFAIKNFEKFLEEPIANEQVVFNKVVLKGTQKPTHINAILTTRILVTEKETVFNNPTISFANLEGIEVNETGVGWKTSKKGGYFKRKIFPDLNTQEAITLEGNLREKAVPFPLNYFFNGHEAKFRIPDLEINPSTLEVDDMKVRVSVKIGRWFLGALSTSGVNEQFKNEINAKIKVMLNQMLEEASGFTSVLSSLNKIKSKNLLSLREKEVIKPEDILKIEIDPKIRFSIKEIVSSNMILDNLNKTIKNINMLFEEPQKYDLSEWAEILGDSKSYSGIWGSIYFQMLKNRKDLEELSTLENASAYISISYEARLKLRKVLYYFTSQKKNWLSGDMLSEKKKPTPELLKFEKSIKRVSSGLMLMEEIIAERAMWSQMEVEETSLNEGPFSLLEKKARAFRKFHKALPLQEEILQSSDKNYKNLFFKLNPMFKNFEFKSGDIVLVYGGNSISSGISRITDTDGAYSHAGIVIIDDKRKGCENGCTIEAHTKGGVVIKSLDEAILKNKNIIRFAVYRHPDAKLAKGAANAIFDELEARGFKIPYDFAMNPFQSDSWYCYEVVSKAFEKMKVYMPTFTSFFTEAPTQMLEGFTGRIFEETQAPSDAITTMQIEPVVEYINLANSSQIRHYNTIVDLIIDTMNQEEFKIDINSNMEAFVNLMVEISKNGAKATIDNATSSDFAAEMMESLNPQMSAPMSMLIGALSNGALASEKLQDFLPEGMKTRALTIVLYMEAMVNEVASKLRSMEYEKIRMTGQGFDSPHELYRVTAKILEDPKIWPYFKNPETPCRKFFASRFLDQKKFNKIEKTKRFLLN